MVMKLSAFSAYASIGAGSDLMAAKRKGTPKISPSASTALWVKEPGRLHTSLPEGLVYSRYSGL